MTQEICIENIDEVRDEISRLKEENKDLSIENNKYRIRLEVDARTTRILAKDNEMYRETLKWLHGGLGGVLDFIEDTR